VLVLALHPAVEDDVVVKENVLVRDEHLPADAARPPATCRAEKSFQESHEISSLPKHCRLG
jgi:hypothetical protein